MLKIGASKSINNADELIMAFEEFGRGTSLAEQNNIYIEENKGATEKILHYLKSINSDIGA